MAVHRASTRSRRDMALRATIASLMMLSIVNLHIAVCKNPYRSRSFTKTQDLRQGWTFVRANRMFNEAEFRLAYRMERKTFDKLLFMVRNRLEKDKEMASRAGREVVSAEARLGILLRMMAGSTVYGCIAHFEVERSTVYHVFRETRETLNAFLVLPGLPTGYAGLKKLADDFQRSRTPPSPLPGCVGALDGIAIRIKKPPKHQHPATFYCRKGYYAFPVQALVDSSYRFLCFSAICRGSTHDSLAHAVSSLGRYLEEGGLDVEFWIAGDEAYICSEYLIVPIPASQASDVEDAFNFYHSSRRMHVEQAFGMLIKKFRILKMLEYSVDSSAEIVGLAMKLHNVCLDNGDRARYRVVKSSWDVAVERVMIDQSAAWYEDGKHYYFHLVRRQGRSGSSTFKRDALVEIVRSGRYVRPAVAPIRIPRAVQCR